MGWVGLVGGVVWLDTTGLPRPREIGGGGRPSREAPQPRPWGIPEPVFRPVFNQTALPPATHHHVVALGDALGVG